MSNKTDNRSASEKIRDLEQGVISLFQTMDNLVRDVMTIKDILKVLDNKVNSIVKAASSEQPINDDVIRKIMIENNVEEMSNRVKNWVAQGFMSAAEQITDNSFVVLREIADDGTIVNPRYQFVYSQLKATNPLVCEKILGLKVGETTQVQEGQYRLQVAEVYDITKAETPQPAAEAAPAEAAPAPAQEAPQADQPAAQQ